MAALISLDEAKTHLRVDHTDDDQDITDKIDEASEIVLDYIKRRGPRNDDNVDPPPAEWTAADVPTPIRAAVKLVLSELYDDRNAGTESNEYVALGYLPPRVTALLHRFRDPAIA